MGADELVGKYFPVHDHGFIALVDYMGSDECIERAARTSYGAGTRKRSESRDLIRYLRRHAHTTPFEMLELKFHCAMPMFIARQWIRHRTANVNEVSGRYSLLPMLFYTPRHEALCTQSKDNKQGRSDERLDVEVYAQAVERWNEQRRVAQDNYEWLTGNDVAKELARIDLPLSTYTQWYWKIDLHNLMHFLRLRVDPHAQFEFRVYGEIVAAMISRIAPLSYEAWIDYEVGGTRFSYDEMQAIRAMLSVYQLRQAEIDGQTLPKSIGDQHSAELDRVFSTLSKRELTEFQGKLAPRDRPSFTLNLDEGKPPEHFAQMFADSVPKV